MTALEERSWLLMGALPLLATISLGITAIVSSIDTYRSAGTPRSSEAIAHIVDLAQSDISNGVESISASLRSS